MYRPENISFSTHLSAIRLKSSVDLLCFSEQFRVATRFCREITCSLYSLSLDASAGVLGTRIKLQLVVVGLSLETLLSSRLY